MIVANWLLGIALAIGFSPVILSLVEHWGADPWSRYSLVFIPLLIWCVRKGDCAAKSRRTGAVLIAAGAGIEILAALISMIAFGRVGWGLAMVGFIMIRGLAESRTALLALWIVPIPSTLLRSTGGEWAAMKFSVAATSVLARMGLDFEVAQRSVSFGEESLRFQANWGGEVALLHLAGLAGYWAIRTGRSWASMLGWYLVSIPLGLLLQFAVTVLALYLFATVGPGLAVGALDHLSYLILTVFVVAWVEIPRAHADRI